MEIFDAAGVQLVTLAQAATLLGVTPNAARQARHQGRWSEPVGELDARTPLWRVSDLLGVPAELAALPRWVRRSASKVPLTASGRAASSTDPSTWCSLSEAHASTAGADVGFVLDGDGIVCVDIDGCLVDGQPDERALRLLDLAGGTWVEVSPSGSGLHIWGHADVDGGRVTERAEAYGAGRYITVTGETFDGAPLKLGDVSEAVAAL